MPLKKPEILAVDLIDIERQILDLEYKEDLILARKDFTIFYNMQPQYKTNWFHVRIAEALQKLAEGKIQHLAIFMPPQHGKSTLSSILFPAWCLGRWPSLQIAVCSCSLDLTKKFCRAAHDVMSSKIYIDCFGDVLGKIHQATEFHTKQGGSYKGVGVAGRLTGDTVDIGIIDDPYKGRMEALSAKVNLYTETWYDSVFTTRKNNKSRELMLFTRWTFDDLAQYAGVFSDPKWEVLTFPALKTGRPTKADPRKAGAPLFPEMHNKKRLSAIKKKTPVTFGAMYQQKPAPDGGDKIKTDWFTILDPEIFDQKTANRARTFYVDTAYTEKEENDPTAILSSVEINGRLYIENVQAEWIRSSRLKSFVKTFVKMHKGENSPTIKIEAKASGLVVIHQLQDDGEFYTEQFLYPRNSGLSANSDKFLGVSYCENYLATKNVFLRGAEWNDPFLTECSRFPRGKHDDRVDVLKMAMIDTINKHGISIA